VTAFAEGENNSFNFDLFCFDFLKKIKWKRCSEGETRRESTEMA